MQVPGFVCLGCLDVLAVSLSAIASAAWSIACVPSELVSWFASATTSAVAVASDAAHVIAETGSDDLWSAMAGLVGSWSDPGPIGAFVFFALVALGGCVLGAFICARIDALITFLETSGWLDQLLRGTRTAARCGFQPAVHAAGMMHDAGPAIGRMMATVWQAVVTVWSVVVSADRFVFDGLTTCITDVVSLVRNAFVRLVIGSCATAIHLGYIAPVAGVPPTLYNSYYYYYSTPATDSPAILVAHALAFVLINMPWVEQALYTTVDHSVGGDEGQVVAAIQSTVVTSLGTLRQMMPLLHLVGLALVYGLLCLCWVLLCSLPHNIRDQTDAFLLYVLIPLSMLTRLGTCLLGGTALQVMKSLLCRFRSLFANPEIEVISTTAELSIEAKERLRFVKALERGDVIELE